MGKPGPGVLFGFQIYFDFAGYSHIALGSGRLMGVVFPENFNFPYLATSPRDFWKRWHISLSSWIRDYLYLPLMGLTGGWTTRGGLTTEVEAGRARTTALFLSWGIMGLWHGAAWTFLWWGLYHASLVYLQRRLSPLFAWPEGALGRTLSWCVTLPFMMLGWIPFRAISTGQMLTMWQRIVTPRAYTFLGLRENTYLVAALILLLITGAGFLYPLLCRERLEKRPLSWWPVQMATYAAVAAVVFTFLRPVRQFIYFQF